MFYLPIFGSFSEATGMILEKKILRKHKINAENYTVYSFLAIVLVMLPLIPFLWNIKPGAFPIKSIILFFAIIIIAIFANFLTFYSMKRKDLTELEPIRLMQPLMTILLAFIFSFFFIAYKSERNYSIIILGLIASISVIATHLRKHHLKYNKYIVAALAGSFLFSLELVLSKEILPYYNAFTFYFLRCLCIFVISWIIFQPKLFSIERKTKFYILITSIIWVIYRIILYYGYNHLGIIFTTILFILTPVFLYIFAAIFLKEKIKLKHIISALIIIACVVTAIILEMR